MAILSSKWLWIALTNAAIVAVLYINCRTEMHTEIVIDATPEEVWAVLIDTERYPEWNPVFVEADGKFQVGTSISNQVVEPCKDAVVMTANVLAVEPLSHINQSGGIPGIITFDHHYYLEAEGAGTRVIQHETDMGLYMYFWDSSWVEPAYASVNEALKAQVEG